MKLEIKFWIDWAAGRKVVCLLSATGIVELKMETAGPGLNLLLSYLCNWLSCLRARFVSGFNLFIYFKPALILFVHF